MQLGPIQQQSGSAVSWRHQYKQRFKKENHVRRRNMNGKGSGVKQNKIIFVKCTFLIRKNIYSISLDSYKH